MRLAVVRDFRAENWPSMDLCADELLAASSEFAPGVEAIDVAPDFRRLFGRMPFLGRTRTWRNADRARNRYKLIPRHLRGLAGTFDAFHVVDHSYAHVVHALPAARTGVFCHDLDAFACLLDPERDPRPYWLRVLTRRVLDGLEKAALVFFATEAVGRELRERRLVDPGKLVHAPLGVSREFTSRAPAAFAPLASLDALRGQPFVLHVGSVVPRKRIDVLLESFAAARSSCPELRLVKVGDEWTRPQCDQLRRLGVERGVVHVGRLSRPQLAEVYRRAAVVVCPSEREGFGLPVVEALACGTPVVASDLPALRESGGAAARFCAVGDVAAFAQAIGRALEESDESPASDARVAWTSRFTWTAHARTIVEAYKGLPRG